MLTEVVQGRLVRNASFWLEQGLLGTGFLLLTCLLLLLEATGEGDRLLLGFLGLIAAPLQVHDLEGGLVDLGGPLNLHYHRWCVKLVSPRADLDLLLPLDGCDLVGVLPPARLMIGTHLGVPQVLVCVMIGLGEVGRRGETLATGLLGPPKHLRGIYPLQDYGGLVVTAPGCGLDARDLAHDRRLLLALFGLLRVQRVVPLLRVRVVLNYLSGLPLGETQLVLVLDGTCHLLLLLLEDNRRSRFADIMLFGSRL